MRELMKRVMTGNPESTYVCACLEDQLFSKDTLSTPPKRLDWYKLLAFLKSQRIAAYFYTLSKYYGDIWPASFREYLRRERYYILIHGDIQRTHISRLLQALNTEDIPVIVLKGWALIQSLYDGDHGQRACGDIDILIRPQDIQATENLLVRLGYCGEDEVWPGFTHRYTNGRVYYIASTKNDRLIVGLHWGLFHTPSYDPKRIDVSLLFESAKAIVVTDQPVLELCLEDQIVYLCSHLDIHHRLFNTMRDFYEIASLIKLGGEGLNWDLVLERAETWQHSLYLKKVINKLEAIWPGIIQPCASKKVDSIVITSKETKMDKLIEICSENNTLITWLNIVTLSGWKKRLGFLFEQAFPNPTFMRKRYKNLDMPVFFAYPYRFWLAVKNLIQKI
jgi:hypothetical protein